MIEMEAFPDAEEGTKGGLFDAFLYAIDECRRKQSHALFFRLS